MDIVLLKGGTTADSVYHAGSLIKRAGTLNLFKNGQGFFVSGTVNGKSVWAGYFKQQASAEKLLTWGPMLLSQIGD
jgi:hypothetical protein